MSTLEFTTYSMPAATLRKDNPLPDLAGTADVHQDIEVDTATITPEESRYIGWGRVNTILPYTKQDDYGRKRRRRAFKAAVLENEHLRATFLPQLGGRLWSLFDKDAGRELLHVNPVFQPCNLALRNAWVSGGVEWNVGIIGHTPFTVDDMICQRLSFSDGTPVLRMFQYERVRHLLYRVEAFLPDGAKELYVRVRIDNATKEDTAVYWWSNMAVDEREDVRVIVPAKKAFCFGYGGKATKVPVPHMHVEEDLLVGQTRRMAHENGGYLDWEITRTMTMPRAMDFFFDVPHDARPFIAAPGADGYGMCQTSTGELRGRKLFIWGMGVGGRRWQTFLSRRGSQYIELQSGLARTQLEHLPMAGGASVSWLESYGAVHADAKAVQGEDWDAAVAAVADALEQVRPAKQLEDWHARVKRELDSRGGETVHTGMGYARCEKALLGDAFDAAGLDLDAMRISEGESVWMTLAQTGDFPCPDPIDEPKSYQIGAHWEDALEKAVQSGSDHWYARYQLGVMAHARGAEAKARSEYERSLQHASNPWALRGLALLDAREGNESLSVERLCEAARMKPIRALVLEALDGLNAAGEYVRMLEMIETLPAPLRSIGRVKTHAIAALMRTGRLGEAEELLNGDIVLTDVREGNVLLTDLWFEMMARKEKGNVGEEALAWAREQLTPPKRLDFRMK